MNHAQNRTLNALLTATGNVPNKSDLVLSFTQGRSESRKDLSFEEARQFINWLQKQPKPEDAANKMRRKIISMAHEMQWYGPRTPEGGNKVDMQRLNGWCEKYSLMKKKLNDYTYNELPALVTQFTEVYKDYLHKF